MTATKAELQALLERVEAATGPDQRLEVDVATHFFGSREGVIHERANLRMHEYTASIDAALALVGRVLPGWFVLKIDAWHNANDKVVGYGATLQKLGTEPYVRATGGFIGATRPLSILAALLKALIAQADEVEA